jgi:hypothetical protein
MKPIVLLPILFFAMLGANAQTGNTAIIYQTGHSYTLTVPEGWVSDSLSGISMMLDMCFHPDTTKWAKSPVVMYSTVTHKTDSNQTIEDVIKMDSEKFRESSPGVVVEKEKVIYTYPQNKPAHSVRFTNEAYKNYESVAYIEEKYHVIMIVVGSRDKEIYEANLPAFKRLAQSYYNLEQGYSIRP